MKVPDWTKSAVFLERIASLLECGSMETSTDQGHKHDVYIDDAGDGATSPGPKDGHVHQIEDWKVLKAAGHTHELDQ